MKLIRQTCKHILVASIAILSVAGTTQATTVEVEVSNLFNNGGLALTPVWTGFHDGTFDTFNTGATASSALQLLAEGGDMMGIRQDFASQSSGVDGAVFGPAGFPGAPVIEPGEVTSAIFNIDNVNSGYFSFLSMLIPTNDAFIGNATPDQYSLFDMMGKFVGLDILVLGTQVWDAGTEVNAGYGSPFLADANLQPRQDENGLVGTHQGLMVTMGGLSIIGGQTPAGYTIDQLAADFTQQGFQVARIRISEVSAPTTIGIFASLLVGIILLRRKL